MAGAHDTGIYEIVNLLNGKRYIGSAVWFNKRFSIHRSSLRRNAHHSQALQRAWNKHGKEAFVFRFMLICSKHLLLFYEQRAIDLLKPEYNVNPTAGSNLGNFHSPEAKAKIGAKALGRKHPPESVEARASKLRGRKLPLERYARNFGNTWFKGKKHTPEFKASQAEKTRARFSGKPKSSAHRLALSKAGLAASARGIKGRPPGRWGRILAKGQGELL